MEQTQFQMTFRAEHEALRHVRVQFLTSNDYCAVVYERHERRDGSRICCSRRNLLVKENYSSGSSADDDHKTDHLSTDAALGEPSFFLDVHVWRKQRIEQ